MLQWKMDLLDPITLGRVAIWVVFELYKSIVSRDPKLFTRWYNSSKYLNYNIPFLLDQYKDENVVAPFVPYSEIFSWLGESWSKTLTNIDTTQVLMKPGSFRVSAPIQELGSFQSEALEEFTKDDKASFNGHAVRLASVSNDGEGHVLNVQRTRYFEQVKSNLVMDWLGTHSLAKAGLLTLRAYFTAQFSRRLPPLDDPRMANSVGVSAIVYYRRKNGSEYDETQLIPYLPRRVKLKPLGKEEKVVAVFDTGAFHCTASGVAELVGANSSPQGINLMSLADTFSKDMYRELEEEVGIRPDDIEVLIPLAATREFLRGGKPQIFFGAITHLSESELVQRRLNALEKMKLRLGTKDPTAKIEIEDEHFIYTDQNELESEILQRGLSLEAVANLHYAEKFVKQYISTNIDRNSSVPY